MLASSMLAPSVVGVVQAIGLSISNGLRIAAKVQSIRDESSVEAAGIEYRDVPGRAAWHKEMVRELHELLGLAVVDAVENLIALGGPGLQVLSRTGSETFGKGVGNANRLGRYGWGLCSADGR